MLSESLLGEEQMDIVPPFLSLLAADKSVLASLEPAMLLALRLGGIPQKVIPGGKNSTLVEERVTVWPILRELRMQGLRLEPATPTASCISNRDKQMVTVTVKKRKMFFG